ncbi:hypothetical protein AM500_22950 [Bacillus sp. FJAT-18017]|uniref:hypothetical protein n=1 Tax=Bacillus sp. FJAT-18017 TaxID=1705566 RepID=UPI0006AFA96E|nr:hypothetical protein [Bacillus sp. FJAT-18017]ALC92310.1 hypothetical protein AM500_22950 [Bacillus sp. FJAT-18017]
MSKLQMKYKIHKRVSQNVDKEYDIVFDKCTPIINGVPQNDLQLLMRYTKNGRTVNNAPAFNEMDMIKTIIKLFDSELISPEAKKTLKQGILKGMI